MACTLYLEANSSAGSSAFHAAVVRSVVWASSGVLRGLAAFHSFLASLSPRQAACLASNVAVLLLGRAALQGHRGADGWQLAGLCSA
jgi:hypothetical protein